MSVILKYQINTDHISLPLRHKPLRLLNVQFQHGKPVAWIEVDDTRPGEYEVPFRTVITGADVPDEALFRYVTTLQFLEGSYILHVYFDRQITR